MTGDVYSIGGGTFFFDVALADSLPVASYVEIALAGGFGRYLGQIESATIDESGGASTDSTRTVKGRGTLLSRLGSAGSDELGDVFAGATMTPAEPRTVAAHLDGVNSGRASLSIGNLQRLSDVPAGLRADGFGRHTFLCGQSGSGKTYTLGVILERLLLETDIRIALLDPNSDYVNMGSLRPQAGAGFSAEEYQALEARYRAVSPGIHVFGGEGADRRLRAKFGRLSFEQQSMVLGLDPIRDPQEFNAFVRIVRRLDDNDYRLDDILDEIRSSFDEDGRRLGLRIENLGIAQQSIWAGSDESVMDGLPDDWRMIVADLGSLDNAESSIASAAVLGSFWEQRHERRPVLLVVDEAHNVCPRTPTDANQALATEHMIRIAGEGRKFGLYLLLSTQRPAKVHPNVLSQCDNLLLMKMNSASDIGELSEIFSFVPPELIELAAGFGLGEGLAAGKISPEPILFRSGRRLTLEGGSDVPSTWAQQRS